MRRCLLSSLLVFVTISIVSWAQSVGPGNHSRELRFVTQRQVHAALLDSLRGTEFAVLNFGDADVAISAVPVKVPAPDLQVFRLTADPKRGVIEARLRCLRQECLPFCANVQVSLPDSMDRLSFSIPTTPPTERVIPLGKRQPPLMLAGEAAKLFVFTPGIRISMPVISLQSGELGQLIRLRAVATGKVLLGRVESKGVLSSRGVGQ
jgi:hypothetical protein